MKTLNTTWEVWTYDVLGNAKDGYEVNDRCCIDRSCELELKVQKNNPDTPQEFLSAAPTDKQLRDVFGIRCQIETDGDDTCIYVNRKRDSYPIGELYCTSHDSLSPIREKKDGTT